MCEWLNLREMWNWSRFKHTEPMYMTDYLKKYIMYGPQNSICHMNIKSVPWNGDVAHPML